MATTSLSFQGITSGLQTDTLISAIIAQDGLGVQRLRDKQTANTARSTALATLRTGMTSLSTSLAALYDSFGSQSVTSTDTDGTYATATASGAVSGSYEVKVSQVATTAKLTATMSGGVPTNLAVADPNATILTSSSGSFAVKGTDGVLKTFQLGTNSLNGLRDAINASGAGVSASIINTGKGTNAYQLVLTAKDTTTGSTSTGTGSTAGVISLAAIDNADGSSTGVVSSLGISAGTLTGTFASPTGLTGGLSSTGTDIGQDAIFSVNGVELTRKSNKVTDAVDGITFNLKKGDSSNTTTLTVAQNKTTATTAMQDVITKYNSILTTYKAAKTVTKDSTDTTGETNISGPLANDYISRSVIDNLTSVFYNTPAGLSSSATYKYMSQIGVNTSSDGTLSLDTDKFEAALDKDPAAVKNLFAFSGSSSSGSVAFSSATSKTATGSVSFDVTYGTGGAVTGSLTINGTTYSGLTGTNGKLQGPVGSLLEGLTLKVSGTATGTMALSRGLGQSLQDMISDLASYSGTIEKSRDSITQENEYLADRIEAGQALLDKRQAALKIKFSTMESTITAMRDASSSLSSL